ncbi:gliding motility-associated C-terminal domain-containing protein [Flavisolibacter tropicus]|uniref:Uncharacterized protein n=1 Tax=Flavisolibacter tropicus TaxID=1492898 RepID=A0A172TSY0_9BACT|nr:gliding motility-associated C-terminal domain-containing protein [Flavisolibacter tropicus]ANE50102.1 hypothetical protein SY85_05920 [Flavisolibacter tropicus]
MRTSCMAAFRSKVLFLLITVLSVTFLKAQMTVTSPVPASGSITPPSATVPGVVVFGVRNTNATPIVITDVSNYVPDSISGSFSLWYNTSSTTGAPLAINTANGWVSVANVTKSAPATSGITPLFTGLNIILPANTTYRFAISGPANGPSYGLAGSTPNVYKGGGLEIYTQDNPLSPGYAGAFSAAPATTPVGFIGSIAFQPSVACTTPPLGGKAIASATSACEGTNFTLNVTGGSIGTGQTYQWQSSPDNATWTNLGASSASPALTTTQSSPTYYRVAVTCTGITGYSASVRVTGGGAISGTFTINAALPTGGSNFQTITDAINSLKCGINGPVVFNVQSGSGPYNEQVIIPAINGASIANTITFNGNGATIQALPLSATPYLIRLDGADYVTINNFTIKAKAGSSFGWGIHLANGADNNNITNCNIDISAVTNTTQNNSAGIVVSNSNTSVTATGSASNNIISNNTITGAFQGVIIYGAAGSLNAVSNTITRNTIKYFYANGIDLSNNNGAVVSFNDISRGNRVDGDIFTGIQLAAGNKKCIVNANRIHDTHTISDATTQAKNAYGIYANACDATSGSENKISNNLIYKFNSGSGIIYALYNNSSDYAQYYHNTVVLDNAAATAGATCGFYQTIAATGIDLKNNIFYITRGGSGAKNCLYFNTTTSTITSNNNILYINSPAGTNGIGFYSGNQVSLANWNSKGYDLLSKNVDPLFANASAGNYTPTDLSIDNLGDYVNIDKDIDDRSRSLTTPDAGAMEFTIGACITPPVPGVAVSSLSSVCNSSTSFTFTVTGATTGTGITYQWQSSTDNSNWTDIPAATIKDYTSSGINSTTYFRRAIICSGNTTYTNSVMVNFATPTYASLPYSESFEAAWGSICDVSDVPNSYWRNSPATGNNAWRRSDDISSAKWTSGNGSYTPAASAGVYSARFHSANSTNGTKGKLDLYLNANTVVARKRLMFDYINAAGNDSLVISLSTDNGATYTRLDSARASAVWRTKTLYFNATSAATVLRFEGVSDASVSDIGLDNINVIDFPDCTGTPVGGTAVSSLAFVCTETFTLSVTGATEALGITYQWQSSADSINWNDINNATASTLTTTQSATTYYRVKVICSNGGSSAPSAGVKVSNSATITGTFTINKLAPKSASNFQSFNDAYNALKCGIGGPVTFNVVAGSGPYDEQLTIQPITGASAVNNITFNGYGNTLSYSTSSTNPAVIKLNGADYITFNDLIITAKGTQNAYGVHLLNDADNNTINNCTVNIDQSATTQNISLAGIVVSNAASFPTDAGPAKCDNNTISGNTVNGGHYGVILVGSATDALGSNKIINNTVKDFFNYGIYVAYSFNTLVEGNTISRPERVLDKDFYGIYFTNLSTKANVTRNIITNPFGAYPAATFAFYGIYFNSVASLSTFENMVSNNKIYNLTGSSNVYGFYNNGSSNVWFHHNTLSIDGKPVSSTTTQESYGYYQKGNNVNGVELKNNIINITRDGSSSKAAVYMNAGTNLLLSDNNDFYISSTNGVNNIGFWNAARLTLASWSGATGQDAHSVSSNPFFTDLANGDLKPKNASIDNRGTPTGITTDFDGVVRNVTSPDLGALEFTAPACVTPPIVGSIAVSETPVCSETPVMLTATGNSFGVGQVFQWQYATTAAGPFSNLGYALSNPDTAILAPSINLYYRLTSTCSGLTSVSEPILITVTQPLSSGTYTINKNAPASATNFVSFNAAKNAMGCGIAGPVVFDVVSGSGPYFEQVILDSIRGTSATNTVTFNGNGNTLTFNSNSTTELAVIKLNGADYVTFDSLTIDAFKFGVHLMNNADYNWIRRCTVNANISGTTTSYAGIIINASNTSGGIAGNSMCDNNTFEGNTVNGGQWGITVVGNTNALITDNRVINNKVKDYHVYGIYLGNTTNTLVEGNELYRPLRNTSTATDVYAIYATGVSDGMRISKNRIHNSFDQLSSSTAKFYGIYFTGTDAAIDRPHLVSNNLIYNTNGQGEMYGIYNAGSDNVAYYHNTISLDNTANTSTNPTYGFYQTTDAEGINLKNNIFTIMRGGTGNKYGLYFFTPTTRFTSDYNNFNLAPVASSYIGFLSANRTSLATWRSNTGKDLNSSNIDPVYTSPATGNLKPTSPNFDNRGTGVIIADDIEGNARLATTPDVGAYEIAVPACTTPPTAGSVTATPSSGICMGTPIVLSLSGNTFGSGISFQWEYSKAGGPYLPLGAPKLFPDTVIEASASMDIRVAVTCSGNTVRTLPVSISLNSGLMAADDYTINPALGAAPKNYVSFKDAVLAMECGIEGRVTFNVAPGIYTEQVRMHKVPGAGANSRVTFQSANGDPASVTLNFNATSATKNYVLQLDSASYITYKDMTIAALNATNGRVIDMANTTSYDSLVNLRINTTAISAPVTATTTQNVVGIYANNLKGGNNVIKKNTITNGSNGIYFRGTSETNLTSLNVIDSNTINGAYHHGIHTSYTSRIRISNNTVNQAAPLNSISYGVYAGFADSAYQVIGNKVTFSNAKDTIKGIYMFYSDGTNAERGKVAGNTVLATNNITGKVYGLSNYYTTNSNTVNNVVSIKTTATTADSSYALYSFNDDSTKYYNNSIYSASASTRHNYAAYFYHANNTVDIRNNIFAHNGGGIAFYTFNQSFTASDYNMLYSSGSSIIQTPTGFYSSLRGWRNASMWDLNSIAYKPAFMSEVDLQPNIADSAVWAMHGRGVQIAGNDYDFNNAPRPTTLTAGVPDLGAYEFVPTSVPPVLTAIPATPVAGGMQTFMMGTDTVSTISWGTTVPTEVKMRRYSGVTPPGLTSATPYMYYYTDVQTTGSATGFTKKDFFIDPWQGFINHQFQIRMGRTDAIGSWLVGANSTVDTAANAITEEALNQLYRFTGLSDVNAVPPPQVITLQTDSSNTGKRFWVGYANSYDFIDQNAQEMVLYLSTGAEPATVTVKVNGTDWMKTYSIPANTAITSDRMPKTGFYDSRLLIEGKSNRGISIESDVAIVAYAHIYSSKNSGATMLLPVGTYGYEYYSLNARQSYPGATGKPTYSSFFVVADNDSTYIQITPSNQTVGGHPADVPFLVTLNKGEVYQVLGANLNGIDGVDLTGSKIVSVPNASGKCFPIGVFSGSSRTRLGCSTSKGDGGDLLFQQVFPSQAWGTRYLTAPTSIAASPKNFQTSIYRVMVKDPATEVKVNGTTLFGLVNDRYYQFESGTADYIEANKPVMVAQYMASSGGSCPGSSSLVDGDPELFYLSPIEQAVKQTRLYRNNLDAINVNYLTLVIPTNGLNSLTIDGSNTFNHTYPHPNLPGYSVVVKQWGGTSGQSWVQSDSAFTGIVYGEGNQESYGYNLGTLVKNLNVLSSITNTLSTTGATSAYACTNSPFKVTVLVPVKPTSLTWRFSQVPQLNPKTDVTLLSPVAIDSVVVNNKKYYKFTLTQDYTFSKVGTYNIPVSYSHPEIEGCNNTLETMLTVKVVQAPKADFTVNYTNCIGDIANFSGSGGNGVTVTQWNWTFGDGTSAATQNTSKQYGTSDTFNVRLKLVTPDGCVGDTTKKVPVNARPTVDVVKDTLSNCKGSNVTFTIKNPAAAVTYKWYNAATGGNQVGTGTNFTTTVNGTSDYFVEAISTGCASTSRKKVTATQLIDLATPVVTIDSASVNMVRFKWSAVQGATSYDVSTDGGNTWEATTPNSLTHTVSGLMPLQSVTLTVKAKGGCKDMQSLAVTGKAQVDQIYIPNSFSPNGDGMNDVLQVYGYVIKEMQFMVYNQWGEKIYESKDQKRAWDGTQKGKLQPSGVYLYVCRLILNDGTVVNKKGSINLVR